MAHADINLTAFEPEDRVRALHDIHCGSTIVEAGTYGGVLEDLGAKHDYIKVDFEDFELPFLVRPKSIKNMTIARGNK